MNRVAFISDIHGNYPALKAVLEHIKKENVSSVYCLGDIVGFNSMINETIYTLRDARIPCLMGNHDYALIHNGGVINRSKTCTKVLQKQIEEILPENREWLASLDSRLDVAFEFGQATLVHGGIDDPVDEYMYNVPIDYFEKRKFIGQWFFHGHTHFPRLLKLPKVNCLNPGSVGQPRDLDSRASYLIVSVDSIEFHRVAYDISLVAEDMRSKGYEEYIIESLYKGAKIGG